MPSYCPHCSLIYVWCRVICYNPLSPHWAPVQAYNHFTQRKAICFVLLDDDYNHNYKMIHLCGDSSQKPKHDQSDYCNSLKFRCTYKVLTILLTKKFNDDLLKYSRLMILETIREGWMPLCGYLSRLRSLKLKYINESYKGSGGGVINYTKKLFTYRISTFSRLSIPKVLILDFFSILPSRFIPYYYFPSLSLSLSHSSVTSCTHEFWDLSSRRTTFQNFSR